MMTLLVTVVLVAPLAVMVVALADSMSSLITAATRIFEQGPPAPPPWVAKLPFVGESLASDFRWRTADSGRAEAMPARTHSGLLQP